MAILVKVSLLPSLHCSSGHTHTFKYSNLAAAADAIADSISQIVVAKNPRQYSAARNKERNSMPPRSKRKSEPPCPKSAPKKAAKSAPRDSAPRVTRKDKARCEVKDLFDTYANKSSGIIDPEGIETLCSDLEVAPTDVRVLMLAWKMEAEKQGYFTQEEWIRGLKALKVADISKLQKSLPSLEKEVWIPENFEKFYSFSFQYSLTEEKQKFLDIESICLLMDIVLGSKFRSQVEAFTNYLKWQKDYKAINRDQWISFLRFCQEVSFPDLENYDTNEAWPVILDNFVAWMRERREPLILSP